jgi:hypothetical protein
MKLQAIIGKINGRISEDDSYEIISRAYSSQEDSIDFEKECIGVIKYNTDSNNIKNPEKNETGKNLYIEFSHPNFRDINGFYQKLSSLDNSGLEFCVKDSKVSEEEYNHSCYKLSEDHLPSLAQYLSKLPK